VSAGKILTISQTYADDLAVISSEKSLLSLVVLFLLGAKSTAYSVIKHNFDVVAWNSGLSLLIVLAISVGFFLTWVLGLQLLGNHRKLKVASTLDFTNLAMIVTLFIFAVGIIAGATDTASSVLSIFGGVVVTFYCRNSQNLGSLIFLTGLLTVPIAKYEIVKAVFRIHTSSSVNYASILLMGTILAILTERKI